MRRRKQINVNYESLGELPANPTTVSPRAPIYPPVLVTGSGVRRLFGNVSAMTVWRWRRDDPRFPVPFVINGRLYFNQAELLAWAQSKTKGSRSMQHRT